MVAFAVASDGFEKIRMNEKVRLFESVVDIGKGYTLAEMIPMLLQCNIFFSFLYCFNN